MALTTGIGLKACEIFNKLQFAIHDTVKLSIFSASRPLTIALMNKTWASEFLYAHLYAR
jgi:hypothetical protein